MLEYIKNKMNTLYCIIIFLTIISVGCVEKQYSNPLDPFNDKNTGALQILIIDEAKRPVENAMVVTRPDTRIAYSDSNGLCLLNYISTGIYEIYASHEWSGGGKGAVQIGSNQITLLTIELIAGVVPSIIPSMEILSPLPSDKFAPGEAIQFTVKVKDSDTPLDQLKVTWQSSIDRIFRTMTPNSDGLCSFSTEELSSGGHVITVTVIDSKEFSSKKTFDLVNLYPNKIHITEIKQYNGQVEIVWVSPNIENLESIQVFRALRYFLDDKQIISVINDPAIQNFIDTNPPFTVDKCYYQVVAINFSGYARESEKIEVSNPSGPISQIIPEYVIFHPDSDWVYFYAGNTQSVQQYDYRNMKTTASKNIAWHGYGAIGDFGKGMEICMPMGAMNIYDPLTLDRISSFQSDGSGYSADGMTEGYIIVCTDTYYHGPKNVIVYERNTGQMIDGLDISGSERIRRIPGKREFISISKEMVEGRNRFSHYRVSSGGMIKNTNQVYPDKPTSQSLFDMSPNGEYFISSQYGILYAADSTLHFINQIPYHGQGYSDYTFNESGSMIYAASNDNKTIQAISYPALVTIQDIPTRGYPRAIYYKNNRLVSISNANSNQSSWNSGYDGQESIIEVIPLSN